MSCSLAAFNIHYDVPGSISLLTCLEFTGLLKVETLILSSILEPLFFKNCLSFIISLISFWDSKWTHDRSFRSLFHSYYLHFHLFVSLCCIVVDFFRFIFQFCLELLIHQLIHLLSC